MKRIFLINDNIDYSILSMQSEYFLQINYPYFLNYMFKLYNLYVFICIHFSYFVYCPSLFYGI